MVTAEQLRIRPCEARDLDHFGRFGSDIHVRYCRDEFAHGRKVILVAVWLEAAAVARPLQRQGIGTSLVRAAEALAAERGYGTIELGVEDTNPDARRLYERLGYRSVARNDFQYVGAPIPNPGVVMRKELQ